MCSWLIGRSFNMEPKEFASHVGKSFPESFYDAIAYVVSGTVGISGALAVSPTLREYVLDNIYKGASGPLDISMLLFVVLCVIYLLGLQLTFLSYYVLSSIIGAFARLLRIRDWYYDEEYRETGKGPWSPWHKDFNTLGQLEWIQVRRLGPDIGLEVTKRFARLILARNASMACFGVAIVAVIEGTEDGACFFGIIGFLLALESLARRCWFHSYLRSVMKVLKEMDGENER